MQHDVEWQQTTVLQILASAMNIRGGGVQAPKRRATENGEHGRENTFHVVGTCHILSRDGRHLNMFAERACRRPALSQLPAAAFADHVYGEKK